MSPLPKGIVSVLQTPFDQKDKIDFDSLARLIEKAIAGDVNGFLVPVVASEVDFLSPQEREQLLASVVEQVKSRVPIIAGASHDNIDQVRFFGQQAHDLGADAWLVAVPQPLYQNPHDAVEFFLKATRGFDLPLVIQDFQFNGPGLPLEIIQELHDRISILDGIKIETLPSGPKYTAVRKALGKDFWISGGWAVTQLIEALDRGVDAMIPESSMVAVYSRIYHMHVNGYRDAAQLLFRRMQPVLCFSNQDVGTSVAFFKRLLVRKGIFKYPNMRWPGFQWDQYNSRIADELFDLYCGIEADVPGKERDRT